MASSLYGTGALKKRLSYNKKITEMRISQIAKQVIMIVLQDYFECHM